MDVNTFGAIVTIVFLLGSTIFFAGCATGEKSVKTDLPKREEELKQRQMALDDKVHRLEKEQQDFRFEQQRFKQDSISHNRYIDNLKNQLMVDISKREASLNDREVSLGEREKQLALDQELFEEARSSALTASSWLAQEYADLDAKKAEITAYQLETKNRPAFTAADKIREFGRLRREAVYQAKAAQYQLDYLLSLNPHLEDELEMTPGEAASLLPDHDETATDDPCKSWLSPEEYQNLPNVQKWQRALDHYNNRKKSNWQLGIEYERYIGYLLEQKGYKVRYFGATEGRADMGRDLIAENKEQILIVQCKRWSKDKTIHENHIFQLYGTTVLQRLHTPSNKGVLGVFVTTTSLSPLAGMCANYLGLKTYAHVPLEPYPQIKCNISNTGERIYHLPFDQQYDRTMLNPADGDMYVSTVLQAEAKGFRRAYRWHGQS